MIYGLSRERVASSNSAALAAQLMGRDTRPSEAANRVGSTELRWQLPGVIAPGASGHVSFQAIVR